MELLKKYSQGKMINKNKNMTKINYTKNVFQKQIELQYISKK